jgi:hypothetical protein
MLGRFRRREAGGEVGGTGAGQLGQHSQAAGDPTVDITAIRDIRTVVSRGRVVDGARD